MRKMFCDKCTAEIENPADILHEIERLFKRLEMNIYDICEPCYSELKTTLNGALRKWKDGENK
jgi:hypothetical protein